MNSSVCYHYPQIVEKIKARGDDVLGHGRTNAELLRGMWEHDEARAIEECTETSSQNMSACGRQDGWARARWNRNVTPDLLKRRAIPTCSIGRSTISRSGCKRAPDPLLSVPYPMELNDAGAQAHRDHTGREFGDMIVDQFEEMLEQSRAPAAGLRAVAARLHRGAAVPPASGSPSHQALRRAQAQGSGLVHARRRHREILLLAAERPYSGQ